MSKRVLIAGGGLAGLACAQALAERGFAVTLLESRDRLGGRAGSFTDRDSGQLVDACQHVSMGCCTNFAHFCETVGVAHLLAPQPALYFVTADRRVSKLAADPLPAPAHLARSLLTAHYLTPLERLRVAFGMDRLRRDRTADDPPFVDWLRRRGQTDRTIDRFWAVVLVSALNETIDRVGLRYARKVFADGFMRHRKGFEVSVPRVPLGRLYGDELRGWLARRGVTLRLGTAVKSLAVADGRVTSAVFRNGGEETADYYVLAVPWTRVADVLPPAVVEAHACFRDLGRLGTSPITSVHLWFDRPVTRLPHAVLVGTVSQWAFNRGETAPGEHYLQVVVSASRGLKELGHDEARARVLAELARVFPAARGAAVVRSRVVTEHAATFSVTPGVDRWRPAQETPVGNLFLAGDWTDTGWPATMEGAVRGGYRAAEAVLRRTGRPDRVERPDLS